MSRKAYGIGARQGGAVDTELLPEKQDDEDDKEGTQNAKENFAVGKGNPGDGPTMRKEDQEEDPDNAAEVENDSRQHAEEGDTVAEVSG